MWDLVFDKKLCVRVTFSEKKQERVRDKSANFIYRTDDLLVFLLYHRYAIHYGSNELFF
jgi:hypothetical protein